MADLTTVAKVRANLGLPTSSEDEQLAAFVTAASADVAQRLSRPILATTVTEVRDGTGGTRMLLEQCPATGDDPPLTVTSVTIDGATIPARPAVTALNPTPDGWVLRGRGVDLVGYVFTRGARNVTIVYSVGYATVPADLEQAVIDLVALKYLRLNRRGKSSESIAGESITFSPEAAEWASILTTLDRYAALPIA